VEHLYENMEDFYVKKVSRLLWPVSVYSKRGPTHNNIVYSKRGTTHSKTVKRGPYTIIHCLSVCFTYKLKVLHLKFNVVKDLSGASLKELAGVLSG
jgi:hypothetical protein